MTNKKKAIRKTKKKTMRSATQSRAKIPARKKQPAKRQKKKAGVIAVEFIEVESIGDVEDVSSFGGTKSGKEDDLDEDFPPEYGGSE